MFEGGLEFGSGFAVGFFVIELILQEAWYRISMYRAYGVWRWKSSKGTSASKSK